MIAISVSPLRPGDQATVTRGAHDFTQLRTFDIEKGTSSCVSLTIPDSDPSLDYLVTVTVIDWASVVEVNSFLTDAVGVDYLDYLWSPNHGFRTPRLSSRFFHKIKNTS